ncbi:DNA/RNA non-specific endonuclease [Lachnospiraceae bacterium C10]|nr:DNA/RNA non-specific endonuclease [Lachnospiraceae bacterium C10]
MFNFNMSEIFSNMESRLLEKARNMEKPADAEDIDKPIAKDVEVEDDAQDETNDVPKNLEPNKTYEINGNYYETDDNGNIYKTNGELNPDTEYTVNGITYVTDSAGRIISWEGEPGYNPEAERDSEAQTDAGGEDRKEGDDGGHLVARILDGSSGNENIVPMRDTVNRGDYKKAENEIAKAKQEGKDVQDSGNVIYEGDSSRPDKIERTYSIDGEKRELKVDNVEGSQDLLDDVKNDISEEDYENLEERINDMEEDGSTVSVTSVYKKYDSEGNLESVTVGVRDETNGTKTYITYDVK